MPIYEYRCENGHTFEAFQSMSDDPLEVCEVCEAPASRVLSAPAIHYKGSGFYTTDYARKGSKKAAGADGGSGEKSSKSEGKGSGDGGSGSGSGSSDSSGGSKSSEKAGSSSSKSSD